ncbi:UDP-glycosyltransferase 90A1-like [Pyrus ussuriensis x Pyrus communis]|uniref:Glycosyltransferase n=1 Tax=Pyrus ussuriensis x Pyrus communis TaxID=2448454 RepID=A0A5N5G6F9_9ROSA|nr:UDP-glycosyltransferase 90A1-like [Pyrus ussuriensis x Pyrus communis]
MATSSPSPSPPPPPPPHVVIFPFMAQGHTIPLLDISKELSNRGLKVTIVTTPLNAPFIHSKLSNHTSITVSVVPFPYVPDLPEGCENTADLPSMDSWVPFVTATKQMKPQFETLLHDMVDGGSRPLCVISDFFLGWTLDTCRSFDIPRVVSHGMGVLPMLVLKTAPVHVQCQYQRQRQKTLDLESTDLLPNLALPFTLDISDLPPRFSDLNDAFERVISEVEEVDKNSWGVIVNSFQELESWCVGPVLLYEEDDGSRNESVSCPYIKWLDGQDGSGAAIYVSFGTQVRLSDDQMDEIAYGLEMAGYRFIWAVRSKTGFLVRDWVDQRSILAHPTVGGFLSHCGWNSVMESLSMGVPLLAWPMGAEQPLNAKYVAVGLKAGLMVKREKIKTVDRHVICEGVRELMGGEKGRRARERARVLGSTARRAVEKGGSSDKKLDELIKSLIANANQKEIKF